MFCFVIVSLIPRRQRVSMRGSCLHSPVSMSAMSSINYLRLEHEDPVLWDVQAQHIFT